MLEVRNISSGYDGAQVLWDVSLRVESGEVVALMGPNGSGKSTLMNGISRIVPVWRGEIIFEGRAIHTLPPYRMISLGISHVLERHRLFPAMTVFENLSLGCGPGARRDKVKERLEAVYQLFPRLREREKQIASSLSGGEQQMCAIARGLMGRPQLLLIDEPFMGLSPHVRNVVAEAIRDINRSGVTVLMIEQNVAEALRLSQRAYVLREGRVVLTGRSETLRTGRDVEDAFLARSKRQT